MHCHPLPRYSYQVNGRKMWSWNRNLTRGSPLAARFAMKRVMLWGFVQNIPQDRFPKWWSATRKTYHLGPKIGHFLAMRTFFPILHTILGLTTINVCTAMLMIVECWMLTISWKKWIFHKYLLYLYCTMLKITSKKWIFHMNLLYLPQHKYCTNVLHIFPVLY